MVLFDLNVLRGEWGNEHSYHYRGLDRNYD